MIKQLILLGACTLASQFASAQFDTRVSIAPDGPTGQPGLIQGNSINNLVSRVNGSGSGKETVGTPYADERWLSAELKLTSNVALPVVPLRYDVLNKRLLLPTVDRKADSLQFNDSDLASFTLIEPAAGSHPSYKRTFRRFTEASKPSIARDYVEVIYQGPISLVKRYEKLFIEGGPSNGLKPSIDRINEKITYFLIEPGKEPVAIKLKAKAFQDALPAKANELGTILKDKKAKSEQEWAAILTLLYQQSQ